jgi:hypothetical protein
MERITMMLYLKLFHGRKDPTQAMDDWGADGPIFGPYTFVHTTYSHCVRMGRASDPVHDLYSFEDMIYYDSMYYGDWSVIPEDVCRRENPSLRQSYDGKKAELPRVEPITPSVAANPSVKVVIYIHGGICQEVRTNLPEDSWQYAVVDYDNEPDLPEDYVPFSVAEMAPLSSLAAVFGLIPAAQAVIANWEKGA